MRSLTKSAKKIIAKQQKFKELPDEEFKTRTEEFRKKVASGTNPNSLLVEAYALVREAAKRTIGQEHFKCQLMGGVALNNGNIIDMKTGEGKTLTATTAAYLNALSGKVHVVTTNEYLAKTNCEAMLPLFDCMGMSCTYITQNMSKDEKRKAYACDIVYSTAQVFCFDYLFDNMRAARTEKLQQSLDFAIIDEVDSVLIDDAKTPLIVTSFINEDFDDLSKADLFVKSLKAMPVDMDNLFNRVRNRFFLKTNGDDSADYIIDKSIKQVFLTDAGIEKAKKFFNVTNFSTPENAKVSHYITQALRANYLYEKNVNYIVNKKGVEIIDESTGRILHGRQYGNGLHQAIEAKEGVQLSSRSATKAMTTFKNYFSLYKKISGMSGTASCEKREFKQFFDCKVVKIPTNKKCLRTDCKDKVFVSKESKYQGILQDIKKQHELGRPILVATPTVAASEELSALLKKEEIDHYLLNAKNPENEAYIVAQAGRLNAVTVATNMAGRGTDIKLGGDSERLAYRALDNINYSFYDVVSKKCDSSTYEMYLKEKKRYDIICKVEHEKVLSLGGLYVISTEKNSVKRVDMQLIGRSGRQGDPGESQFYISAEDHLFKSYKKTRPTSKRGVKRRVRSAQKQNKDISFEQRRSSNEYDDIDFVERTYVYNLREVVIASEKPYQFIEKMAKEVASTLTSEIYKRKTKEEVGVLQEVQEELLDIKGDFSFIIEKEVKNLKRSDKKTLCSSFYTQILDKYEKEVEILKNDDYFNKSDFEKRLLLRYIDETWSSYLETVTAMQQSMSLYTCGNGRPIDMYKNEVIQMHEKLNFQISSMMVSHLLSMKTSNRTLNLKVLNDKKIVIR